jgi:hypothetical protein
MDNALNLVFEGTFFALATIACIGLVIGFTGLTIFSLKRGFQSMVNHG